MLTPHLISEIRDAVLTIITRLKAPAPMYTSGRMENDAAGTGCVMPSEGTVRLGQTDAPQASSEHPHEARLEIHMTGFMGMRREIGLGQVTIKLGDQELGSIPPSALPRFSRAIEKLLSAHHSMWHPMGSAHEAFHQAAHLMGYVPDKRGD